MSTITFLLLGLLLLNGVSAQTVSLNVDFNNGLDGWTVLTGSWTRQSTTGSHGLPDVVLSGDGTVRSHVFSLTGGDRICMEAQVRRVGTNELKAEAFNGVMTKQLHTFSATTSWKTETFWLVPVQPNDSQVQLQFVSTNPNAELDNIKQLSAFMCGAPSIPATFTYDRETNTFGRTAPPDPEQNGVITGFVLKVIMVVPDCHEQRR